MSIQRRNPDNRYSPSPLAAGMMTREVRVAGAPRRGPKNIRTTLSAYQSRSPFRVTKMIRHFALFALLPLLIVSGLCCHCSHAYAQQTIVGGESIDPLPMETDSSGLSAMARSAANSNTLTARSVAATSLSTNPELPVPSAQSINSGVEFPSPAAWKPFLWQAEDVSYRNLMFEEPVLERHGVCQPHQVIRSGILFYGRTALLPLDVIRGRHRQCDNPLGW